MSIDHVMKRIGRIVAADQGLQVHVRGNLAFAVRGEVTIPSIETYEYLGDHAERMLHGLLDHECAHATDTDFDIVGEASGTSQALKHLHNAIEDGYIEGRQGLRYRGCGDNLRDKNTWFWTHGEDGKTVPVQLQTLDVWSAFLIAATLVVRPYGGQPISAFAFRPDVHAMLLKAESELALVKTLYGQARASRQTLDIAKRIFAMFDPPKTSESKGGGLGEGEAPSGEGEPGEGDSGDSEGEGAEGTNASPGESEEEAKAKEKASPGKGKDKGKGKTPGDLELTRWTPPNGASLTPEQAISRQIKKVFKQPSYVRPYIVFSDEWNIERDFSHEAHRDAADYEEAQREAAVATDVLVSAFEVALRAKRERRPVAGSDEGEVDPAMLAEFSVGSAQPDRIFCEYVAEDDRTVAVSILVDCSGSMAGDKAELAKLTAIAMHQALTTVQIQHEVCGFTTINEADVDGHVWAEGDESRIRSILGSMRGVLKDAQSRGVNLQEFARSSEVPIHAVFKGFGSDDGRALTKISGIGNNLDGEAVLWQARRLARRPETRKVMFVLSDGYPAGSHDNAQGARYLRESVRRVIEAGIEVYGIGMKSKAVAEFYPQHLVCWNMEELSQLALGALTDVLIENRQEQKCVTL